MWVLYPYGVIRDLLLYYFFMILRSDYYPFGTRAGTYAEAADMPAVVVTIEEHRAFTNKWREAIGYNTKSNLKKGVRTTSGANKEYIQKAAQEIYKDYPELLEAVNNYLK